MAIRPACAPISRRSCHTARFYGRLQLCADIEWRVKLELEVRKTANWAVEFVAKGKLGIRQ